MSKIKKPYNFLALQQVKKMKRKKCDLSVLPRFLSPYFKTSQFNNSLFLQSKETNKSCRISFSEKNDLTFYFQITTQKFGYPQMWISATTNKELLTKIIKKYELFN
jgi:hypothetical protein